MSRLNGRRVLLCVSGGIAAYKAPLWVRALRGVGAEVRVVLTRAGREFVSPLALEVVSENPVHEALFEPGQESDIGHIELARWADVVAVAPATANVIAKARAGMADDLLTTLLLATTAPVVVFPAMNTQMWMHAATQENVGVLRERGVRVVDPDAGQLACKEVGAGRMPDPPVVLAELAAAIPGGAWRGRRVCITAGPTVEHFDPVRYLSNPSSGRMGYALARAMAAEGAAVTLISGPTALETPHGCLRVDVRTAADMCREVLAHAANADALVMSAAVADWTPRNVADEKRKKHDDTWEPVLERTTDILAAVAEAPARPQVVIGFAAETESLEDNARAKLTRKRLDGIVANDVSGGAVFGSDQTRVVLLSAGGRDEVGPCSKDHAAAAIVRWAATLSSEGAP